MAYELHGTDPTSRAGFCFYRSNWAWPPLATLCRELVPELADKSKYWICIQGAGLSEEDATQLAERLERLIADGTVADYIRQFHAKLARLPDELCGDCEGNGNMSRAIAKRTDVLPGPLDGNGDVICLPCRGEGNRRPAVAHTLLDEDEVKEWVCFLRACGGFYIV